MDWEELLKISLALALLIAPPILIAWIFRWAWKLWRPESELRGVVFYIASFAVWLLVISVLTFYWGGRSEAPREGGNESAVEEMEEESAVETRDMPAFPWPPPAASAETLIPDKWLPTKGEANLENVAFTLQRALRASKYPKWSYSSVPNGFALVSQMEQIKVDGTPSPEPARWSADLPWVANMTLIEFIRALVNSPPGYYRVIVFIVTNRPWPRTGEKPTGGEAKKWLAEGFTWLPQSIGEMPYGPDYRTTALVYEFKKVSKDANAFLVDHSATSADDHLKKAGISEWLSRR